MRSVDRRQDLARLGMLEREIAQEMKVLRNALIRHAERQMAPMSLTT